MASIIVFPEGSRPARALDSALRTLGGLGITPEDCWLGGGATLAARWRHRRDESVNLFLPPERFREAFDGNAAQRISEALPDLPRSEIEGVSGWARWETGHGRAGVFSSRPSPAFTPWLDGSVEARHGIPLERPGSALMKKLSARFSLLGEILDRDLMDIVAASRLAPEELREALLCSCIGGAAEVAEEIRHMHRITPKPEGPPGEALGKLREEAARIIEAGPPEAGEARLPEWMREIPSAPRSYPPGGPPRFLPAVPLAPLEGFSGLREPAPFRGRTPTDGSPDFTGSIPKNMAGHPMQPEPEEIRDWLLEEEPERLPRSVLRWMGEALDGLTGRQAMAFRQGCGASLLAIARMAHAAKPHGRVFPPWLNRHAWRSAGDMREEVEAYGFLAGRHAA